MRENVYEVLFILDPNRFAREARELESRIAKSIEKQGGTIIVSRPWEERRLAYPIKGHRKGAYWLAYFRLDSSKLAELVEQMQRNDSILRHLVVRVDPRIVDTLVAHATSGGQRPRGDSGGAPVPGEPPALAPPREPEGAPA